jgi:hypothetical protein
LPIDFLLKTIKESSVSEDSIKNIIEQKEIQEAIFLASPNLSEKISKWLNGGLTDKKEIQGLTQSIYKYLARMSGRSTPFGLFAGNSVGQITQQASFFIPEIDQYRRVTRLDMNFLCSLIQDLSRRQDIRELSRFFPNNSIYNLGNKIRFVEYHYLNTKRIHQIASVDNSIYLRKILEMARKGSTIADLSKTLVDDEISMEESCEFINELIDSQLLVSEFEPAVSGNDMLENLIAFLQKKNINHGFCELLEKVNQQIRYIDSQAPGVDVQEYEKIQQNLKQLVTNFDPKYLFQADMVKPTNKLSINRELSDSILEGIAVLNSLSVLPRETNLSKFREAFYKKYEDAEIPLMEALDTESGIGYVQHNQIGAGDVSPLLDNLYLPQTNSNTYKFEWNNIYTFLFNKFLSAIKENQYTIEITEDEIKKLGNNNDTKQLPPTISTMVQLIRINKHTKVAISSAGGSAAANLLGRFCHTDEGILKHVKDIISKEEAFFKDKIIAEIVHLPESRIGNILHRPVLRKYEIPYLAKSSVAPEFQILPEDLMISVKSNRIFLRSKRLNKEIIPRLTTAHNYSYNALPVYQFLCDLQTQDFKPGAGFNWGPLANHYPFSPRVVYKDLIFSLASWNLQRQDFEHLLKIKNEEELLSEIEKWRIKHQMLEWVALEDGDNELPIKLSNGLSVKTLISSVKNRSSFKLSEFFTKEENMVISNKEGFFTNEFIFSFYREPEYDAE